MDVNPYQAPRESAISDHPLPPLAWKVAFYRGLIATFIGFVLIESLLFAEQKLALDPHRPGASFTFASEVSTAIFAAGVIATAIAAVAWWLTWLVRRRTR